MPAAVLPSAARCARALWLLGLRDPADRAEIHAAWKARVAQTHPDRRGDHPEAAHRLTAAFNDARDVCLRWADAGQPWPSPSRRVALDGPPEDGVEADETPPPRRRAPSEPERRGERRSGLRPGDLVRPRIGGEPRRVTRVTAASESSPVFVRDEHGSLNRAEELTLVGFACPVCGGCRGPLLDPSRRPCTDCLSDLERLEHRREAPEAIVREIIARAARGRAEAERLGASWLAENARERVRWAEAVRRRPRDERRDALLAAFAHGFAVWGDAAVA